MSSPQSASPSNNGRVFVTAGALVLVVLAVLSMRSQDTAGSTSREGRAAAPAPKVHRESEGPAKASGTTATQPGDAPGSQPSPAPLDAAALNALMKQGADLYNACVMCHGPTGEGIPGQYPPLKGSPIVGGPESRFARVLLQGLEGVVVVDGKAYNMPMPAAPLNDDDEAAAVMTFVRRSFGNNAPPVRPETVARIREETKAREKSWTAQELDQVP